MRLSQISEQFFGFIEASHARAMAALVLVSLVLFLPGITSLPPMDRDEPRFAQASKQMLETGDMIDIRFQDEARHKKPVGIYWLQVASVSIGEALHVSDARRQIWLYRLPSQLGAILTVLFTYAAALAFMGRRAAFTAALLMASVVLLGVEARLAKTDGILTATATGAMAVFAHVIVRRESDDRVPSWAIWAFWIAMGIGILVKGPITPAIAGLAALVFSFSALGRERLRALRPGLGAVIVLALVLPWFIAITIKSGGSFFVDSVGQDMLAKVGQGKERHGAPPGTYLGVFFGTAWPMVPFVLLAIPFAWRERRDIAVKFLLLWLVPMWLVFEAVPTKLPHYVLPLYPALAILVALAAERGQLAVRGALAAVVAWYLPVPLILLAAGLIYAPFYLGDPLPLTGIVLLIIAALIAVAGVWVMRAGKVGSSVIASACASVILAIAAYAFVFPVLQSLHISEQLARSVKLAKCDTPELVTAGYAEPSLVFLTRTDISIGGGENAAERLVGPGCRVAFVEARLRPAFEKRAAELGIKPHQLTSIYGLNINSGRRVDVAVYDNEGARP